MPALVKDRLADPDYSHFRADSPPAPAPSVPEPTKPDAELSLGERIALAALDRQAAAAVDATADLSVKFGIKPGGSGDGPLSPGRLPGMR